jgi:hypothetical protein
MSSYRLTKNSSILNPKQLFPSTPKYGLVVQDRGSEIREPEET